MKLSKLQMWCYGTLAYLFSNNRKVNGWRRFESKYREMDAYYHKGCGMVVKRPKFIMDRRTPKYLRVPTFDLGSGWVVQPFVKKTNLKAAVTEIKKELKKYPSIKPDVHVGNVGWYDGKAVLFDW